MKNRSIICSHITCRTVLVVSYIIAFADIGETSSKDCSSASSIKLGTERLNITYESEEFGNDKICQWTIPADVKNDEYVVVLVLENVTLTKHSGGCRGSIRFPVTTGYHCASKLDRCLAYATTDTKCSFEKIEQKIASENHSCKSFTTWEKSQTQTIEYDAGKVAHVRKEFILHYIPIYCIEPTTTTTTTTEEPNTAPSAAQLIPTTTPINTKKTSASAATEQNNDDKEVTSTANGSSAQNTAQINTSTIITIVAVAFALMLLLGAGIFLHKRKKKNRQNNSKHQNKDEMVHYEEYHRNEQQSESANEKQEDNNQQNDDTSYDDVGLYTAVNKNKRPIIDDIDHSQSEIDGQEDGNDKNVADYVNQSYDDNELYTVVNKNN